VFITLSRISESIKKTLGTRNYTSEMVERYNKFVNDKIIEILTDKFGTSDLSKLEDELPDTLSDVIGDLCGVIQNPLF
jgi:hypothetical protein